MTKHEIRDASGRLVAIHERIDEPDGSKRFSWRQPDGRPGLTGMPVVDLPLYGIERLDGMASTVVVAEGERAAEALWSIGVAAVGTVTGAAATPSSTVLAELGGRRAICWPDADAVGERHMARIAERLADVAASVSIVEPPNNVAPGWDVVDAIAEGRDVKAILAEALRAPGRAFRSAQSSTSSGEERTLPFRTTRSIGEEVPERIDWHALGFIATGAITELVGKIKAAGKTTWITHAVRAIVTGTPFMGRATLQTGVVYLTEQSPTSFRVALARAGLLGRDDVVVLFWRDTAGISWPVVVGAAVAECSRLSFGLLVVDTLPRFAGLRGDAENNAGDADQAMAPLQRAAANGLAVVVVRHERKAGGEVGDSGRGSSAFGGAVDIVLALKRGEGATRSSVRVIHALSRFDETPSELVVELTADGYVALGDAAAFALAGARERLLRDLPQTSETALAMKDIVARLGDLSASTIERARDALMASGDVLREGKGVKNDPFRYWLGQSNEDARFVSSLIEDESGQNEIAIEAPYPSSADEPDAVDVDSSTEPWVSAGIAASEAGGQR